MDFLFVQLLNGLASASSLFLVASGLSIIFGVSRVVNFAHGSFYMLGAYVAWSIVTRLGGFGGLGFWGGIVAAALIVGVIGVAVEILILRRIYRAPELFQLLATFGVVLIVQDVTLATWGPQDLLGPRAPGLRGSLDILGQRFPQYELLLIAIGPAVLGLVWWLFHRTRWGVLVRAATTDREMAAALGVDQKLLFTSVFFLGACLAGLGGGLQLPREPVALNMDLAIIADAFVVVVVGGLGSVGGAYLAALLIAELQAFLILAPDFTLLGLAVSPSKMTLVPGFIVMAVVLVLRPHGLLGRPQALVRGIGVEPLIRPASPELSAVAGLGAALLLLAPIFAGDYAVSVMTEIVIFVLVAASLHFMMGPGGMASFGHAAYFGLGAYGAALAAKHAGAPMEAGLIAAPMLAALGGVVFGWFCVRLSGVYLAMLTLAFAQIVWSIAFQWSSVTGGDNGLLGVWPSDWAQDRRVYYYLALVLCIGGAVFLRRVIYAPFGYALRGSRDLPLRAAAIGIDVQRVQWAGFVFAATFAGLAGGLFAFAKGSVFPTYAAISKSVDALLMVLLGGVQTVSGPIVGAIVYAGLHEQLVRATDYWRAALGIAIIVLVLAFPQGIAGAFAAWREAEPHMTVLSVRGLRKDFGGVQAVAGISFDLAAGEMLALIGPNGAGKTTCFNLLNGQLRPDEGSVALAGQDITGWSPSRVARRGVGRTFQITATFASMTVRENVQMALMSHRRRLSGILIPAARYFPEDAEALLAQVGMKDQADRACGVLAYGDLKRVEFAVALAGAPRVLLMDEPTAGMAPAERRALMELVAGLARAQNIAVLFTEHDMDVVFGHADRIIVLSRGRVIADGAPDAVRADRAVQDVYLGTGVG